jgi:hypothetical protein
LLFTFYIQKHLSIDGGDELSIGHPKVLFRNPWMKRAQQT